MKRKSNAERLLECLRCRFIYECDRTIRNPKDNPDGSCKTRDEFLKKGTGLDDQSSLCWKSC